MWYGYWLGFGPYQNKPFHGPHHNKKSGSYRKRPYEGNSSLNPTQGDEGMETPPPNDSFQASLSPPVGGKCKMCVLYPVSPVKERNRKGGKCKISGFYSRLFLVPSNRPKQAQLHSTCRKVQNGDTRAHQGLSDSRGMGVIDRLSRRLPSHPHPPKLKEVPKVLPQVTRFQFTSLPFGLTMAPQVFTMIVKEVKLMALSKGIRLHQYLDDWLIMAQFQEEAQINTKTVVDLTQSLGWIINQEKSGLKPTQVFSFVGYEYHLDSALVKPTQERWLKLQDLILRLKSKHVLTARCLMSLIGLLASTEKMVPEGRLHMRPFQFHLKEHWRFPQSLDTVLPWAETISGY